MNEATHLPSIVRNLLTDPACYDHAVGTMQLVETHISWVVLTGEFAYKIKKPLDLGFLDFSSLSLRQHACEDEVRLNRRLAAGFYLGVVGITGSEDAPHINSSANDLQQPVIEYAVKMRQFPLGMTLDSLDERGELGTEQIDCLATQLAKFHESGCDIADIGSNWGEPKLIAQPVDENFKHLSDQAHDSEKLKRVDALKSWCAAEHMRLTPLMHERKVKGKIRECHGDMHLGNLAWVDGQVVIFDCIEFNPALRWIDVVSEVAFCFMDLLHRQHGDLAMRFLNAWLEITGDYEGIGLLRYYAVYRALVRAKVAALRADQSENKTESMQEVNAYLLLAQQLIQAMPTQLYITHGLSGSGKTTLSQKMLQIFGMIRLRSDIERKRLAGMEATEQSGSGIGQGMYTKSFGRKTYVHLSKLTDTLLFAGWPVIVDAAFLERWQRDLFRGVARRRGVSFLILDIKADINILRGRISQRIEQGKDASEANLEVLQNQIKTAQPLEEDELCEILSLNI